MESSEFSDWWKKHCQCHPDASAWADKQGDAMPGILGEAQERKELPAETDLLLMMGHLHALYLVTLSSFYQGDIETIAEGEVLLRGLIRQALGGPVTQGYSDQAEKKEWDTLKMNFLKRRELEL